jgi:uncharacterized HAD superfamily protein
MSAELSSNEIPIIEKLDGVIKVLENSVVSFDIDGVEVNSAVTAITKLNNTLHIKYKTCNLTSYSAMVDLIKVADGTIEDPRSFAVKLWNSEDVLKDAPPASGAWLLGNYLRQSQLNIHRISSRPSHVAEVTFEWYATKMPWIDQNGPSDGDRAQLASHKIDTIRKLGVQYHFEDSFEEAEAIVENTNAKVVLVPNPWNCEYRHPKQRIITVTPNFNRNIPKLISLFLDLDGRI